MHLLVLFRIAYLMRGVWAFSWRRDRLAHRLEGLVIVRPAASIKVAGN